MHLMLDLETLGTRRDSAILSIGAVSFDPDSEKIGEQIHLGVDVVSCQEHGLYIDAGTVMWWLEKEKQDFPKPAHPLAYALHLLSSFYKTQGCEAVWSNGATFDIPIIEFAYYSLKADVTPWKYWDARDTRTVFWLAGYDGSPTRGIATHSALEDALLQVRLLQEAIKKVRGGG